VKERRSVWDRSNRMAERRRRKKMESHTGCVLVCSRAEWQESVVELWSSRGIEVLAGVLVGDGLSEEVFWEL